MSYGNRSKEYDWFKHGKEDKKSPKSTFKTIWRFTKIFLMFSLFFFSMWGCVQVFIIKTNNQVGNGVEFYNSEDEISPKVTEFKITQDTNGIYSVDATERNVWVNKHENKGELTEVQGVLKSEGTTKDVHKLSDAFKGVNSYVRLIDKDEKLIVQKGEYLAMSTEQKIYSGARKYISVASGTKLEKFSFQSGKSAAKLESSFKISQKASAQKARFDYQMAILSAINDAISGGLLSIPANTQAAVNAHNNNINEILSALSPETTHKVDATATTPLTANLEFGDGGLLGSSTYRPIITWSHAWKRGVGPFYGLFVWPISKLGVAITDGMGMNHGWESLFAIIVIVFILRILAFGLTFKSVLQQTKQQEVQAKKAVIDAKYASYKGNKQMEARKRQETAELYKKEGISPLGAIGTIFITMPIFLSIWRVIGGVPHLKSTVWLGINFSATSYKELFAGEWQYLPLILIAAASAGLSQLFPRLLTKRRNKDRTNIHQRAQMKKNNRTQNIVLVVYIIMSVIFSAGIQVYWIVGGIWQVIQATITHRILIRSKRNSKRKKVKL